MCIDIWNCGPQHGQADPKNILEPIDFVNRRNKHNDPDRLYIGVGGNLKLFPPFVKVHKLNTNF
jgi:hypothetical protein